MAGLIDRPRSRAGFCLVLFLSGLLFSGLFHGLNQSYRFVYSDAKAYLTTGKNLAYGLGYTEGERSKWRDAINRVCPLYIASLAGLFALLPEAEEPWQGQDKAEPWEVKAILVYQTVLYALGAVLVYLLGRQVWDERIGRWGGLGAVLLPDFATWAGMVVSEPLFLALFLAGALLLFRILNRPERLLPAAGTFFLMGLTTLVRPNLLLPTFLLAGYLAFRSRWRSALVGAAVFVLVLTPFTVRNYFVHDRLWYATSTADFNFYVGNMVGSLGEMVYTDEDISRRLGIDYATAGAVELTDALKPKLRELITKHPWHLVKINLYKGLRFFSLGRTSANAWIHNNNRVIRWVHLAAGVASNVWLFILGPFGLLLARGRPEPRRLMLSFTILMSLASSAMYIQHRHRFVFLPFLLLGAISLTRYLKDQWWPRLKSLGVRGLWASLTRTERRWVAFALAWIAFILAGSVVDGLVRFGRFLNFIIGENRYL